MNAWFKMSNTATNSSSFPVMNTASPDAIKILYRAPISSKWLCCVKCLGCPCTLCCWDNIKERTYFFVMENRIEWNAPSLCSASGCWSVLTCKCKPADNVSVLYFDHTTMQNAAKTECCKPASRTARASQRAATCAANASRSTATASAEAAAVASGRSCQGLRTRARPQT